MTHVANQRIKKDGKSYRPDDPIELTTDELAALPEGAVSPAAEEASDVPPQSAQDGKKDDDGSGGSVDGIQKPAGDDTAGKPAGDDAAGKPAGDDAAGKPAGDDAGRLAAAVAALTEADFRKDGVIRAESLRQLIETLGFAVTAEAVAGVKAAPGAGQD